MKAKCLLISSTALVSLYIISNHILESNSQWSELNESINFKNIKSIDDLSTVKTIISKGCRKCHSPITRKAINNNYPLLHDVVGREITTGIKSFQIEPLIVSVTNNSPLPNSYLNRLESVIIDGSMPPLTFEVLHPSSIITAKEKTQLLNWINSKKQQNRNGYFLRQDVKNDGLLPNLENKPLSSDKVKLGSLLFNDKQLSKNSTFACSSCHDTQYGNITLKTDYLGQDVDRSTINSPTVFNSVFKHYTFWNITERKARHALEAYAFSPYSRGNSSIKNVEKKISKNSRLSGLFRTVYEGNITTDNIYNSILQFDCSVRKKVSRFDRFLTSDKTALTPEEKEGYQLFKKYKCHTCHAGSRIGEETAEVMGLKKEYFHNRDKEISQVDLGLYTVTGKEYDKYRFKVPSLRNIELTAPYFHDGNVKTLEQAVYEMAEYQVGVSLSHKEVQAITYYLKSLTNIN